MIRATAFFAAILAIVAQGKIIPITSPTQMLDQVLSDHDNGVSDPATDLLALDLDLFLGTYTHHLLSELAYDAAWNYAKGLPRDTKLIFNVVTKHQSRFGFSITEKTSPTTLVYEVFTWTRNCVGNEFALQDPRLIEQIRELKKLKYHVRILTAREEERQKALTAIHLKVFDGALTIDDVTFCGKQDKPEIALSIMKEHGLSKLYFGDDSERTLQKFEGCAGIEKKSLFWLQDAPAAYPEILSKHQEVAHFFSEPTFVETLINLCPAKPD